MANTGFKGIGVRQTGNQLVFRVSLKTNVGIILTTGTTTLSLYELQSDGTLKSYDFNDHTFKTSALTTETVDMTHRTGNNNTTNTGLWTYVLSTLSGFTINGIYIAVVKNSYATPNQQEREFQYGGGEGDILVTAGSTGESYVQSDVTKIATSTTAATNLSNIEAALETGTSQAGGASTITLRSGASSSDDYYKNQAIFILSGPGAGQTNKISSYVGSTKVATVSTAWVTQPTNSSTYLVVGRIE